MVENNKTAGDGIEKLEQGLPVSKGVTERLGSEKISKLLLSYAIPAIIAMTAASLYNIVDSIYIGRGVGPLAISGLAVTLPLMNLAAAFGSMVGVGASSLISIRLGQGNVPRAFLILGNTVLLNIVIGVGFTALSLIFLEPILLFFGASPDTLPYSLDFMRVIVSGNVITHVYLGLNEVLRATGYPRKSMVIIMTAIMANVVLDPLFIFVFGWGIQGAAIATVIAQIIALVLLIMHFSNKKHTVYFRHGIFRFIPRIIKRIIAIGTAPFLLNLCASVVVVFINNALKNNGGDIYIGAYGIMNRVVLLFIMIVAGLNQGMQPIVGYNFGARRFDRVTKTLRMTVLCAVSVTTAGFIICQTIPEKIAFLFTNDKELISVAAEGMRIVVLMFPIVGFQIVTSNFFQYIGKPKKAIFLSMTRQLLFLVPLLAILPGRFGSTGVWMSMPIADFFAAMLAAILLYFQLRMFRRNPEGIKII